MTALWSFLEWECGCLNVGMIPHCKLFQESECDMVFAGEGGSRCVWFCSWGGEVVVEEVGDGEGGFDLVQVCADGGGDVVGDEEVALVFLVASDADAAVGGDGEAGGLGAEAVAVRVAGLHEGGEFKRVIGDDDGLVGVGVGIIVGVGESFGEVLEETDLLIAAVVEGGVAGVVAGEGEDGLGGFLDGAEFPLADADDGELRVLLATEAGEDVDGGHKRLMIDDFGLLISGGGFLLECPAWRGTALP